MNDQNDLAELKKSWYRKRKLTTAIGIAQQCLIYFEYASVTISALYYYKNSFNVSNSNFYYGCTMAAIFVSGVISVKICGKHMDKTRDLRKIVMLLLICNIAGNLIYTTTFSPWCPIVGRLVCGLSTGGQVVFSGRKDHLQQ